MLKGKMWTLSQYFSFGKQHFTATSSHLKLYSTIPFQLKLLIRMKFNNNP